LLIEKIQHLDVESRRLVEAVNRVVKQDVCVLEEPGRYYDGQRNAQYTGLGGNILRYRKDDQDACGSAAGWAE